MPRSLAQFSESEASNHTPSLAGFTTTTPELKFSVHGRLVRSILLSPQPFSRFRCLHPPWPRAASRVQSLVALLSPSRGRPSHSPTGTRKRRVLRPID